MHALKAAPRAPIPELLHPKLEEVRRLLNIAPELPALDMIDDEGVRIIAGLHALRRLCEEAAERLIDLLDDIEAPDVDREDDEREEGDEREPDVDQEPSLGSLEQHPGIYGGTSSVGSQESWAISAIDDAEDEHDGAEPDDDGEPALGWTDFEARYGRYPEEGSGLDDGGEEHDGREPDDNGIGDRDGLAEQTGLAI
jgi:hypothetical protein